MTGFDVQTVWTDALRDAELVGSTRSADALGFRPSVCLPGSLALEVVDGGSGNVPIWFFSGSKVAEQDWKSCTQAVLLGVEVAVPVRFVRVVSAVEGGISCGLNWFYKWKLVIRNADLLHTRPVLCL